MILGWRFVLRDAWLVIRGGWLGTRYQLLSCNVLALGAVMDTATVMDIAIESLTVTTLVAAPILAAALLSGLLVGVIQAATSIQEMTLSFIPKLAVMMIAVALFGEWQLAIMMEYFQTIFERVRVLNG